MTHTRMISLISLFVLSSTLYAQDADTAKKAESKGLEHIRLNNGSLIVGEVQKMVGGTLEVKTLFGVGAVKVKWDEVVDLTTDRTHTFVHTNGSRYVATATEGNGGKLVLATAGKALAVAFSDIAAINPPAKKLVMFKGNANLGATLTDGNTQTKSATFSADFEVRAEKLRLALNGAWNHVEGSDGLIARNTRGGIKTDGFFTERLFAFAAAFFEEDRFQDLNLRTALSAGPGYQLVNPGDFSVDYLSKMEAYVEAGLSFFDEDFRRGTDNEYVAARSAFKLNLPVTDGVTIFHRHQGYPGVDDLRDIYILSEQGIRFTIVGNIVATLQANYRWDNTPSPGLERDDTQYLATLGYTFSF